MTATTITITIDGTADAAMQKVISEAVARLPLGVQEFVSAHCYFVVVPRGGITFYPGRLPPSRWIVALDGPTLTTPEGPAVVAHEITHALLGHHTRTEEWERATAELVASWGFTGQAARHPAPPAVPSA